jgi:hypothetical protein
MIQFKAKSMICQTGIVRRIVEKLDIFDNGSQGTGD